MGIRKQPQTDGAEAVLNEGALCNCGYAALLSCGGIDAGLVRAGCLDCFS